MKMFEDTMIPFEDMMIPVVNRIRKAGEEPGECRYETDTAKGLDSYCDDIDKAREMGYHRVRPLIRATVCGEITAVDLHANGNFRMYVVEKASDGSEWLWLPDSPEKRLHFVKLGGIKSESMVTIHRRDGKGGAR